MKFEIPVMRLYDWLEAKPTTPLKWAVMFLNPVTWVIVIWAILERELK